MVNQFALENFYVIERQAVLDSTTQRYRDVLKNAGYGDFDSCSSIGVSKLMLKADSEVRSKVRSRGMMVSVSDNNGGAVVNINQANARRLAQDLDCQLPTVGLMYILFIPFIKELARQENSDARNTLDEMLRARDEILEDRYLDIDTIKIGRNRISAMPLSTSGSFSRDGVNSFGYPHRFVNGGEFQYWHHGLSIGPLVSIRRRSATLDLDITCKPRYRSQSTGLRLVKIL